MDKDRIEERDSVKQDKIILRLMTVAFVSILITFVTMNYFSSKIVMDYINIIKIQKEKMIKDEENDIASININAEKWAEKKYTEYINNLHEANKEYREIFVKFDDSEKIGGKTTYKQMEQAGYHADIENVTIPKYKDLYGVGIVTNGCMEPIYGSYTNMSNSKADIKECIISSLSSYGSFKVYIDGVEIVNGDSLESVLTKLAEKDINVICNEAFNGTQQVNVVLYNSKDNKLQFRNKDEWVLTINTAHETKDKEIVYETIKLSGNAEKSNHIDYIIDIVTKDKLRDRYIPEFG